MMHITGVQTLKWVAALRIAAADRGGALVEDGERRLVVD
jgi:hypothetical protein